MKNKYVSGILMAILGALIAFLPTRLIDTHCITGQMKCFWAGKTELGLGILIVILALLFLYFESRETRLGLSLALALIGVLSALVSSVLIGFCCGSHGMKCVCSPAAPYLMTGLNILVVLASLLNLFQLRKSKK
jgi:hypothetical protein